MNIDGRTRVVAVIGDPIEHTRSPVMHNAAFRHMGLNRVYVPFHVEPGRVGDAVRAVRGLEMCGMNVTVPHKQAVMEFVDELSDAARAVGAVNTIINRDGHLTGDNTDVYGIIKAVEAGAGVDQWPRHVVVLGAGGAARGVAYALSTVDAVEQVTIMNRTAEKAEALAEEFGGATRMTGLPLEHRHAQRAMETAGLVINVTSLGRGEYADMTPVPPEWDAIHGGLVLVDSNYSPPVTRLMRQVEEAGGKAYNGYDMLVWQGARSLELWTGEPPPVAVMLEAVRA